MNLQETHLQDQTEVPPFVKIYGHLFHFINSFANRDDPSAGILICISKNFQIEDYENLENGRLLGVKNQKQS